MGYKLGSGYFSEIYFMGSFLSLLVPVLYFLYIYIYKPKNVSLLVIIISALTAGSFLITLGQFLTEVTESDIPFYLSLSSLFGWLLYYLWSTRMGTRTLLDTDKKLKLGQLFHWDKKSYLPSEDFKYRMFVFYRGSWCPFCMGQIRENVLKYAEFSKRGVEMNFVSTMSNEQTQSIAKKYNLSVNFLIDQEMSNAQIFGIDHGFGLPLGLQILKYKTNVIQPTVVLTDQDFNIINIHKTDDYKKRPEPEFFLRIIDSL